MKTLKDYCNLLNGYAFKSDEYVDDGIRVVRITNVQKGEFVDSDPKFYPLSSQKQLKDYLLQENDLLVSLTGNVGRVCMISKVFLPAGLNQRVACLRIKNKNLLKEYLYFYLMRNKFEEDCIHNSRGIAQLNLSTIWLENYPIKVPTPEQQTIVVDNLIKISKNISELKKNLHFFDELTKSRFNDMFGDPILNELAFNTKELSNLTPFNTVKNKVTITEETWLLNLDMIESETGRIIEKIRTNDIGNSTIEFDTTCVLYSKLRPYLNKVVIPNENGIATSELISMKCDPNFIRREYLAAALRHPSFVNYINSKTGGAKMPRANMDELRTFKMPVPNIQLQNEFASFVEQIDKLKFNVQKQIKYYQELLDLKMHEYFDVEEED